MNEITLTEDQQAKLEGTREPVAIRGSAGRLVGQFVPQAMFQKMFYSWLNTLVTDQELDAAKHSGPGRTLAEILKERGLS